MRRTPAVCAGTAVITSEEGSGIRPLGTHTPTESSGIQRRSETIPGAASTDVSAGRCASLNARTARIICRSAPSTSGIDRGRRDLRRRNAKAFGARAVEALGPLEQRSVAAVAYVGHDRRHGRDRVVETGASHGTIRSIGRTRIDEAPASRSAGSSVQMSSASTAA